MQTFLPYPSFKESAECLDFKRLGKQRVEAYQLLRGLLGITSGWIRHPAATMWRGYEGALALYMDTMIKEWISRGYRNTMRVTGIVKAKMPPWLGDQGFHASHRSNLLRKDPTYYGKFGWSEGDDLKYVWPRS